MKKLLLILLCVSMIFSFCNQNQVSTCSICKMNFQEDVWAKKCEKWCLENNSCNAEITKHSIQTID